ncbi:hypothetical protein Strain138_002186 [Pseudogemmatithrix spongiicola]|uniref:Uncharacterized protein n=1 Tax=Pseudogemmatithrix spongiicola TaxID=3062599 RepID=A0AA49JVX3_9BACT|nr:hypothetical protein Strain138_002186 [Gemmatimonadaceae bacterium 'strain 138']WKW15782.1 hypothetical protein Strain318_002185 [Gemmatimonadaceae bacterium 'strain 318']
MRRVLLLSFLALLAGSARPLAFNDPPRLSDLIRCPARLTPRDTSVAIIFAGSGAPRDSILVRVFGGHRGLKLPTVAMLTWDSVPGALRTHGRSSGEDGLAWMPVPADSVRAFTVRSIAMLNLRVMVPAARAIDSIHAILQLNTPQACLLQDAVSYAAG